MAITFDKQIRQTIEDLSAVDNLKSKGVKVNLTKVKPIQ